LEYALTSEVFRHFQVLSNELHTPKVLVCPQDQGRVRTNVFAGFRGNANLSYFVGLDADESKFWMFLSGDRTISTNQVVRPRILTLTSNSPVRWAEPLHPQSCYVTVAGYRVPWWLHPHHHAQGGYIGMADGSAFWLDSTGLKQALGRTGAVKDRLAIP
jgi:hypothetical protein